MKRVHRFFKEGDTIFFTHVTFDRRPILLENVDLIWQAIRRQEYKSPFDLIAWVVLPDHLHLLINPLSNKAGELMKRIKLSFAAHYRKRINLQSGRVWQNRYWDHIIRDEEDMNRHLDYIHFNPVKHGLVASPLEFEHSSYASFLQDGFYERDWGTRQLEFGESDFGE